MTCHGVVALYTDLLSPTRLARFWCKPGWCAGWRWTEWADASGAGDGRGRPGLRRPADDQRVTDLAEIVGQDAQSDPTLHAELAVVPAASQPKAALEQADAALHPGSE